MSQNTSTQAQHPNIISEPERTAEEWDELATIAKGVGPATPRPDVNTPAQPAPEKGGSK